MNKPDGGPAFPRINGMNWEASEQQADFFTDKGMTLRDYFAAKAMQGLIAGVWLEASASYDVSKLVGEAYQFADEMLKAREVQS